MIIDFIKSWLYYPTLKQWLRERNINGFSDSRFQYAYKHCRMKKCIEEAVNVYTKDENGTEISLSRRIDELVETK